MQGTGISDGYGLTVDNVQVYLASDASKKNLLVNGDFSNSSNNWQGQVQTNPGYIYNGRWGSTIVCELDASGNSNVSQIIEIP